MRNFVVPDSMNPQVRLKNIWQELRDAGVVIPPGDVRDGTISLRYRTDTISLFTEEN